MIFSRIFLGRKADNCSLQPSDVLFFFWTQSEHLFASKNSVRPQTANRLFFTDFPI